MTGEQVHELLQRVVFWGLVLYTLWSEGRVVGAESATSETDEGSRFAIKRSVWLSIALAWALSGVPATRWQSPALFWAGISLMYGGLLFRQQAIRTLGRAFSIYATVQDGQQLVQSGPYRMLRHPAYAGALLSLAGLGLTFGNALSVAVIIAVPLFVGYRRRIRVEEAVMQQAWGEAYRDYMRRTYRLIPFVW
jgi:protein-S-isoprenylcysteine O-methyltransferase